MDTTEMKHDHNSKFECKTTPHLSSAEAEFEGIRLATRINEWYRDLPHTRRRIHEVTRSGEGYLTDQKR